MADQELPTMQRFNNTLTSITETYHRFAVRFHMSDMEYSILDILLRLGGGCTQSSLALWLGCPRQTISSACERLVRQGIIEKQPGEGRRKILTLTQEGRAYAGRTVGQVEKIEDAIFDGWTKQEREEFIRLTEKYMLSLKEEEKNFGQEGTGHED
ncbi:MAG: MarR family winged helix-turn-helix transcriptional regulator [Lachnospiraceae bacterium]|jgi:DNA-binding MarR family transcriptional regulator